MYELNKTAFGSFLAQLRREKGMTQKELAACLYVSDKAVSKNWLHVIKAMRVWCVVEPPMPNENEHPRYTDPDHPYSGSGLRYQNNYNRNEYHAGDGPFQFPWWAIVIGFVVWWPLGFIFIGLNAAMIYEAQSSDQGRR